MGQQIKIHLREDNDINIEDDGMEEYGYEVVVTGVTQLGRLYCSWDSQ